MNHDLTYYRIIQGTNGTENEKQAQVRAYRDHIQRDFESSLNWEQVIVNGGEQPRDMQVIPGGEMTTKKLVCRPGEQIRLGDRILWRETEWIVNALDADDLIGRMGTMTQCNLLLRWQLEDGSIHEEYGWAEDGSRYALGESYNTYIDTAHFVMKTIVQLNDYTLKLERGKRFLLGPVGEGMHPLAVEASRFNTVTNTYEYTAESEQVRSGIVEITLHETQFREGIDNIELGVADYVPPGVTGETGDTGGAPEEESGWF